MEILTLPEPAAGLWAAKRRIADPPYGHAIATVDGQLEKVLSSHQILCGKLERVDQMLVRDVFDVLTAADEQPELQAAVAEHLEETSSSFNRRVTGWLEQGAVQRSDSRVVCCLRCRRLIGALLWPPVPPGGGPWGL